jgi:predicted transcriptional regulator
MSAVRHDRHFAMRLPAELLTIVEQRAMARHQSTPEFIRQALVAALARESQG